MYDKLTIKILPAHRKVLEALAAREQERISVVVRRLIKAEAEKRGLWPRGEVQQCAEQ